MATEQITPPTSTVTMADVLAKVEVTPGDAIGFLNSLAEANADKSSSFVASLNKAIEELQSGTASTEPASAPSENPPY